MWLDGGTNYVVNRVSTMRIKNINDRQLFAATILMTALGVCIRFCNLTNKMLWADEIASIVHALGNSFSDIRSNQVVSLADLLKPLEVNKNFGLAEVVKHGIFEDFVPPSYFMLLHWWILLFKKPDQLIDVFTVRSLTAILSVLSIPSVYLLMQTLFPKHRSATLLAAALMMLSPYSIALAQEVRHYSIAIVLVIISILVFFQITQQIIKSNSLSIIKLCLLVGVNFLGIASHYFFVLVMMAEAATLMAITYQYQIKSAIGKVIILTLVNFLTVLTWMPVFFLNNSRDDLTAWAQMDATKIDVIANLFLQLIVSSITMIALLPVESSNLVLMIISALTMLVTIAAIIWLVASRSRDHDRPNGLPLSFLKTYLFASMFSLIITSCLFKKDFLTSPRYHFIYFPVMIVLISYLITSSLFGDQPWLHLKKIVISKILIVYLFGLILCASTLSVVNNLSFLKPFHADLMAEIINKKSVGNTIIVTNNQNLIDTSHTMALGWQLSQKPYQQQVMPRFFLDRSANSSSRDILIQNALKSPGNSPPNSSLWLINYDGNIDLNNCSLQKHDTTLPRSHYKYYLCQ